MPTHFKALFVVIIIAVFSFAVMAPFIKKIIPPADFRRWRNLWLIVTCLAFLTANFWIYIVSAALIVMFSRGREVSAPALYWLLLCTVPITSRQIPGFGLFNYLIALNVTHILAIVILLPALIVRPKTDIFKASPYRAADLFFMAYFLLGIVFQMRNANVTSELRYIFVQCLVVLVPYYAFSRRLRTFEDIKRTMLAYLVPLIILAAIGSFELLKGWKLYAAPGTMDGSAQLFRAGLTRAVTTGGQAIIFGYIVMIAIGFMLPFAERYASRMQSMLAFGCLGFGLVASLSRGPWLGAVLLVLVYMATGRNAAKKISAMGFVGLIAITLLSLTSFGGGLVDIIPFVGSSETGSVNYRERLFEQSWIVIGHNPWFGSVDYLSTPEMQSLIQGQGIIDIVNSYIRITLNFGFTGLLLFVGFFAVVLINLRRAYKALPVENSEMKQIGRAIFATLCAVLVTIATVSSISFVPYLYWTLAGLAVAYTRVAGEVTHAQSLELSEKTET